MAALEMYLKGLREARGVDHMRAIWALRDYMKQLTENEAIQAIQTIEDIDLMRYLIEAGLQPRLMQAVLKHYDELLLKKGGG